MTDFTLFILPIAFLCCGIVLIFYIFCCSWYQKRENRQLFCSCCIYPKDDDSFEKEDDLPRYDELPIYIDVEDNPPSYEEATGNMTVDSILHSFQKQVNTAYQYLAKHIKGTPEELTRYNEPRF